MNMDMTDLLQGDDVQTTYRRLQDTRSKSVAIVSKREDIDRQLSKLQAQRRHAIQQEYEISRTLESSIKQYCQAWNLSFARNLHARLPPELRDMVYEQIWCHHTIMKFAEAMKLNLRYDVVGAHVLPHFTCPSFMGPEVAREIMAKWYDLLPTWCEYPNVTTHYNDALERVVCEDIWQVGLIPANVLKQLFIHQFIEDLAIQLGAQERLVEILRCIKKKEGFRLEIGLNQSKIRLNLWLEVLALFRPVLEEFEREGAQVRIYFSYEYLENKLEMELSEAIKDTSESEKWRQDAIEFFESHPEIQPRDRHYLYENDPEYDPEHDPEQSEDGLFYGTPTYGDGYDSDYPNVYGYDSDYPNVYGYDSDYPDLYGY